MVVAVITSIEALSMLWKMKASPLTRSICIWQQRVLASVAAQIKGYEQVRPNDEEALLMAVASQPVSVAVDPSLLQLYGNGIITGECGVNLKHAITAVGYGTDENGTKYWIFKNSSGTSWGENGCVRLARDIGTKEGMCGIAIQAWYPTA